MKKKIYVVTFGCYSDYYIDRVFSTKEKAEEYLEWCDGIDDGQIEIYEIDSETEGKFYRIDTDLSYFEETDSFEVKQTIVKANVKSDMLYINNKKWNYTFQVVLVHSIPTDNYNSELHTDKCKKAVYDYGNFVKLKRQEGYSIKEIQQLMGDKYEF